MWKNDFVIPSISPVHYREVNSKGRCESGPQKSIRYNVFATSMFFYESLIVALSIPNKSVCYTEVSAIYDVRCKESSLYFSKAWMKIQRKSWWLILHIFFSMLHLLLLGQLPYYELLEKNCVDKVFIFSPESLRFFVFFKSC